MGGAGGGGLWQNGVGGEGDRFVMTFSDVFLPVPFWRPLLTFTESKKKHPKPQNLPKSPSRVNLISPKVNVIPNPKKLERESKMTIIQVFWGFWTRFRLFFDFFRAFLTAPGTPFQTFFRSFLGRGFFDPCRRPTVSQRYLPKSKRYLPKSKR